MSLYIRENGFCEPGDFGVIIESGFGGTFAKVRSDMKEEAERVCMLYRLAQGLTDEEILQLFGGNAKERIEKLESENAELDHALGFAIDRVERLEAEKAEMAVALKTMVEMVEMNGFGKHYALDLARAAIGREEK